MSSLISICSHLTHLFLQDAKIFFELVFAPAVNSHRHVGFVVRGQTLSIGLYLQVDIICHSLEQAAMKAGLNCENPGGNLGHDNSEETDNTVRLDLDYIGGEIVSYLLILISLFCIYCIKKLCLSIFSVPSSLGFFT